MRRLERMSRPHGREGRDGMIKLRTWLGKRQRFFLATVVISLGLAAATSGQSAMASAAGTGSTTTSIAATANGARETIPGISVRAVSGTISIMFCNSGTGSWLHIYFDYSGRQQAYCVG